MPSAHDVISTGGSATEHMNPAAPRCPICDGILSLSASTPKVVVRQCTTCRHHLGTHDPSVAPSADYHEQYGASFLDSLARTRVRQGLSIAQRVRQLAPGARTALDIGAGRGWLLDALKAQGFTRCAGADTSKVAVEGLGRRGFDAITLSDAADFNLAAATPFQPSTLFLLDVVEHFPNENYVDGLRKILEPFQQSLELVVLKVPLVDGFLYRTARILTRFGLVGPYEQLYQAGTFPPHFHYFSLNSMRRLLTLIGLELLHVDRDREFEPDELVGRVHALRRVPGPLARLAGQAASALVSSTRMGDAGIFFARPARR